MVRLVQTLRIQLLMAAVLCIAEATPAVRTRLRHGTAARQLAATTVASGLLAERTPYPAAGYRPRIPFELPTENRLPKALPEPEPELVQDPEPEPTTTPPVEDFSFVVTTESADTKISSVEEEEVEAEAPESHVPANTYGAPRPDLDDNTVEIVAAPANRFQPPNKEAVEDFGSNDVEVTTVSPTAGDATNSAEVVAAEAPEQVYGAPLFTADGRQVPDLTYGPPDVTENELVPLASSGSLVQQQLKNLQIMNQLQSGRLIFVPADGTQLRQIYFASLPAQRQRQQQIGAPAKLVANKRVN